MEIRRFHKYVFPSAEEIEARRVVAGQVTSVIKTVSSKRFRNVYSSELFGSVTSGTALATSDIDIRLTDKRLAGNHWAPSNGHRTRMLQVLRTLAGHFRTKGYRGVKLVHARYPLLSMQHSQSRIKVQIVASNAATPQKQVIKSWIAADPQILPIFAVIKSALELRGLTDVFEGGISSYPLLLLVKASMQLNPATTLAQHYRNFLNFYSEFDTTKYAIGPAPFPRIFEKITDKNKIPALTYPNTNDERYVHAMCELAAANPTMPFLICVQDPADKHNDVGRKTFAWKHIVETFKYMRSDLESSLAASASIDKSQMPLLQVVAPYHFFVDEQRNAVRNFASELSEHTQALQIRGLSDLDKKDKASEVLVEKSPLVQKRPSAPLSSIQRSDADSLPISSEQVEPLPDVLSAEGIDIKLGPSQQTRALHYASRSFGLYTGQSTSISSYKILPFTAGFSARRPFIKSFVAPP